MDYHSFKRIILQIIVRLQASLVSIRRFDLLTKASLPDCVTEYVIWNCMVHKVCALFHEKSTVDFARILVPEKLKMTLERYRPSRVSMALFRS